MKTATRSLKNLLFVSICLIATVAFGAQISSNGAGGGNWNNTGTWAGGTIPGAGDIVVIEAGDSVYVTDTRTADLLVMLMDAAGKSVFHVTSSGDMTFTSTVSNNIIRIDPVSFAGPYSSRLVVDGLLTLDNLAVSSEDETTVDIDVDGTLDASGDLLWVYSSLGRNCTHTFDVGATGDVNCSSFNITSNDINNDLTINIDGTFNVTGGGGSAFYVDVSEDCDVIVNINNELDIVGTLRTQTNDDNSSCSINVDGTLSMTSAMRMGTFGTADPTDNVLNMDFSGAYCSYTFMIFSGQGGAINSSALNASTIEQPGSGAATYVIVNNNTIYHHLVLSNTHGSGVYMSGSALDTDNLLGNLTVSSGTTFNIERSGGTPSTLGVNGNLINNGTVNDNGLGIVVNGDLTNNSVFNNDGSTINIGGNFTNAGTFSNLSQAENLDVTGVFTNNGTFQANIDSLVADGGFTNTATYVSGGNNIYVSGNWSNTGTYTFTSGDTISFEGSVAQSISGTSTFDHMVVNNNNGVSISSGMTSIKTLLSIPSGSLSTNGNMTFISDADQTAALADLSGGGSISGNVTVQRFLNEGAGWYMLASPVTGATLADWNNEMPMSGFTGSDEASNPWVSVYNYDESTRGAAPANVKDSGYVEASNITNSLTPGEGWFVYFVQVKAGTTAGTMDVTGPLQTGTVSLTPLSYNALAPNALEEGGWHMLGNPYASPVDWASVTKSDIENDVAYVMGSGGNYMDVVNDGVDYLYSGEGFWVHVDGGGSGSGTVTFEESDKAILTDDYNAKLAPSPYQLPLKMELTIASDPKYMDYSVLRFHNDTSYSVNFDLNEGDSRKLGNSLGIYPNISTVSATENSDVYYNTLSNADDNFMIPVRIWKRFPSGKSETFTITFNGVDQWQLNNKCLILWDSVANVTQKLEPGKDQYTFTAKDTLTAPRIFLTYSTPLEVSLNDASCFGFNDGSATVNGDASGSHTYTWVDDNGNQVKKDKDIIGSSTANNLAPGTYTVWVTRNGDCGTVAATINIGEPDPIIADFSTDEDTVFLNANTTIYFTNSSINATDYFWDFGDGNTSTMENPTHTYTTGGVYDVMMIAGESNCTDTLYSTVVVVDNVGIDELDNDGFLSIYQQGDQTYVQFNLPTAENAVITMHDVIGRSVFDPVKLSNAKNQKIQLSIPQNLFGIYTVTVQAGEERLSKKLYYTRR